MTEDNLNPMVKEADAEIDLLKAEIVRLKMRIIDCDGVADSLLKKYRAADDEADRVMKWNDRFREENIILQTQRMQWQEEKKHLQAQIDTAAKTFIETLEILDRVQAERDRYRITLEEIAIYCDEETTTAVSVARGALEQK